MQWGDLQRETCYFPVPATSHARLDICNLAGQKAHFPPSTAAAASCALSSSCVVPSLLPPLLAHTDSTPGWFVCGCGRWCGDGPIALLKAGRRDGIQGLLRDCGCSVFYLFVQRYFSLTAGQGLFPAARPWNCTISVINLHSSPTFRSSQAGMTHIYRVYFIVGLSPVMLKYICEYIL